MSTYASSIARRHELLQSTLLYGQVGTKPPKSLSCDVVFGSPSVSCRGTGICKINAHNGNAGVGLKQTCRGTTALLVTLDNGKGIGMIMPRELLCVNILRNHLRHGLLRMEQPCPIPADIVAALGLQITALPAGIYPVEHFDGHFHIGFRANN